MRFEFIAARAAASNEPVASTGVVPHVYCTARELGYDGDMAIHDFSSQRLFVEAALAPGDEFELGSEQSHYLVNVLRVSSGAEILVFNGRDGEWRARISALNKRSVKIEILEQTRRQVAGPDVRYLFAPLKHARLDYMVQKAVELGVRRLSPVFTRHTVPDRVNLSRMRANAIEAAEQCGVLAIPRIDEPLDLFKALDAWEDNRPLFFCDEAADATNPLTELTACQPGPVAVLVGPEGGFDREERERLLGTPYVVPLSLGPRVMRADTAAVAVLALVNATLGDWK